jgi:hypothetical protein
MRLEASRLGLLTLLLLAPLLLTGEKVREYYPDGALKAEYTVDSQGRKVGLYKEFHPAGALKVKVLYKLDAMDGAYESWHANGKPHVTCRYKGGALTGLYREQRADATPTLTCNYKDGLLEGEWKACDAEGRLQQSAIFRAGRRHGTRRLLQAGELLSEQEWHDGLLIGLFGSRLLYSAPLEQVRATLAGLMQDPELARLAREGQESGDPGRALAAERATSLARLRGYRYLAGVPWREVALDEEAGKRAAEAAELAAANQAITYEPSNPGWDEARFTRARDALQRCNLSQGWTLPEALDAWISPVDEASFPQMIARRLCLEPRLAKLGLGRRDAFSAMWTGDSSGPVWRDTAVFFPARGWMPVEWFAADTPWTVLLNPADWRMPDARAVKIRVVALDENYVALGAPFLIEHVHSDRELLIFRPRVSVQPDFLYWAEVSGLERPDGTPATISWLVHFVSATAD